MTIFFAKGGKVQRFNFLFPNVRINETALIFGRGHVLLTIHTNYKPVEVT